MNAPLISVVITLTLILAGLFIYLLFLGRKISRLEKEERSHPKT